MNNPPFATFTLALPEIITPAPPGESNYGVSAELFPRQITLAHRLILSESGRDGITFTEGERNNFRLLQIILDTRGVFGQFRAMQTTASNEITKFNFTYAMAGGAWIERANGARDWMSFSILAKEKGQAWIDAMLKKQGWMTGCWIDC